MICRIYFSIVGHLNYIQAFTCQGEHDIAPSIFGSFPEVWHSWFGVLIPLLEQLLVSLLVQPKIEISNNIEIENGFKVFDLSMKFFEVMNKYLLQMLQPWHTTH